MPSGHLKDHVRDAWKTQHEEIWLVCLVDV